MTIDQVNQEWWDALCKLQLYETPNEFYTQQVGMKDLAKKYEEMGYIKTFTNRWKEPN